jgi:predicted nucleic acid-binding protein
VIVYLDANIVIYVVEKHPVWGPKALARIAQLQAGGDQIAVGDASRLECLVGPYMSGDKAILADYNGFFQDPALLVFPISAAVCEHAARIRASHNIKPLDALHLATATENACGRFLTNDVPLQTFPLITVEILS